MIIFLVVILALAAVLEGLSIRAGSQSVGLDIQLTEQRVEPGQNFELVTRVENGGALPITYLCVSTALPLYARLPDSAAAVSDRRSLNVADVYRLWWHQRVVRRIPISIGKRGVHNINAVSLKRGDFLGLRTTFQPLSLRRTVLVYPKPLEDAALAEALGSYCGDLIAQRWLIRDPILTLSVREYTGSEPMHTISWSQTARRGELTVREFDYTRSLHCCVIFCVNGIQSEDTELIDVCCSAVRTVCETLVENGVEPELYLNAYLTGYYESVIRKYTASAGRMQDVLEALARVTPNAVCSVEQLVGECLRSQSDTAAYLLVCPRRGAEADTAVRTLERYTGANVMLIAGEEWEVAAP